MLCLSRHVNEQILIGDDIVITLVESRPGVARIGIEAPASVRILRAELYETDREEPNAT